MPKDSYNNGRLTVQYDQNDPREAVARLKKQAKGKKAKDLTQKEKDDLVAAVLAAE